MSGPDRPPDGDVPLRTAVREIEAHAAETGWDQPARLFALVPTADGLLPSDPAEAERYAAEHPDREEVRLVAAATRSGSTYCALRLRTHDDPRSVVEAPDLVPALIELLLSTLEN